jgi:hypothetical protein
MDELTRERFGLSVPWREPRTRPSPRPRPKIKYDDSPEVIAERVRILCDDLPARVAADRRLTRAIRKWVA